MANNKHLMTGPERKQLILVPRISIFHEGRPRETLITFLIYYIAGNFEAENSFNFVVTAVVGQHSVLPSDVIDFLRCCPLGDFGGKQFYC